LELISSTLSFLSECCQSNTMDSVSVPSGCSEHFWVVPKHRRHPIFSELQASIQHIKTQDTTIREIRGQLSRPKRWSESASRAPWVTMLVGVGIFVGMFVGNLVG
jgi:hypothetical protein